VALAFFTGSTAKIKQGFLMINVMFVLIAKAPANMRGQQIYIYQFGQ